MADSYTEQIIASGIKPMDIVCHPVTAFDSDGVSGRFTEVRINSLTLGELYPRQYRPVSNRGTQGTRLSAWAFRQIIPMISPASGEIYIPTGWISFYAPVKTVIRGQLEKLLSAAECDVSRMVIELSPDLLYDQTEGLSQQLSDLKSNYGVKLMLSEYGDEYCPTLRLSRFPLDYVMLDASLASDDAIEGSSASTAVELAHRFGIKVIACPKLSAFADSCRRIGVDLITDDARHSGVNP